jgi:hypothetical protein
MNQIQHKLLWLPSHTWWQTEAQRTTNKLGHILLQGHTACTIYLHGGITFWTPFIPTLIPTLIICTHITKIKEWLCGLRLADMSQSRKSVVKVKDHYIRNTTSFTNLDTVPSWKMCLIIWESILPGIIFRHWVGHVWRVMVKVIPWHVCADTEGRQRYSSNAFETQH